MRGDGAQRRVAHAVQEIVIHHVAGADHLDAGFVEAALGVDTENLSGALGLYTSMGYEPVKRATTFRKPMI